MLKIFGALNTIYTHTMKTHHNIPKQFINRKLTNGQSLLTTLILLLGLLNACGSSVTSPVPLAPWHVVVPIAESNPHESTALWTDSDLKLVAWPASPLPSGIQWLSVDSNMTSPTVKSLQLGRTPRQMSIFKAANESYHLLWLDQTLPGETQLAASLVNAAGEVQRVPSVVSNRPTTTYSAGQNVDGDLAILSLTKANTSTLYLQSIDRFGRAQPAIRITRAAKFPALTYDLSGRLHLLWLESSAERQWTIHYASLAPNADPLDDTVKSSLIGVIQLNEGEVVTGFVAGVDAAHAYGLWTVAPVGQLYGGLVAGLSLTIQNPNDTRDLNFASLNGYTIRDLSVPPRPLPSLTIGAIISTVINNQRVEVPAAFVVTTDGSGPLRPVYAPQSVPTDQIATFSRPTLSASSSGDLTLTWSDLRGDGGSSVYIATTR
jgi:hypothetical protein